MGLLKINNERKSKRSGLRKMPDPLTLMLIGGGIKLIGGAIAKGKANNAREDALTLEQNITDLENARPPIINPFEAVEDLSGTLSNPYANLGVATKAAEMEVEQADISLANTLDTIQATGMGAGGATALAQAAAKSKQGVSASIETQEANNQKLRAQGEQTLQNQIMAEKTRVQNAEVSGAKYVFAQEDARSDQALNRAQTLYDNNEAQIAQYDADAMAAFTGAADSFGQAALLP